MTRTESSSKEFQATIRRCQNTVRAGLQKMAGLGVVICGTVRDCESGLVKNIPAVNKLIEQFKWARVVIVENDSIDQTKDLLRQWTIDRSEIVLITADSGIKTIPDPGVRGNPWFSRHRIGLMSAYRNKYLDYLGNMEPLPDYVVMVDLDVASFSLNGIAYGFGLQDRWDSLFANSLKQAGEVWKYYDTYAYQAHGDDSPQSERQLLENQVNLAGMSAGDELVRVNSAFGGLAIYAFEAIRNCRYSCEENDDPEITASCEHIVLHRQMANQGFDRKFINPAQIVVY